MAAGISVLRFLAVVQPKMGRRQRKAESLLWLSGLLKKYQNTKKLPGGRSSERDSYHLMAKYILRNALSILSE